MYDNPCILCCAITGSLPSKADNSAVPISISEQIENNQAAVDAGASILHANVRNDDETPSCDPGKFAALKEGLEENCPGLVIQFSTGVRSGAGKERGRMLSLRPNIAALTVGSNNFPTRVYENSPDLIAWPASEMSCDTLAPSNAALIKRAADLCDNYERPVATIAQTRAILGLKSEA